MTKIEVKAGETTAQAYERTERETRAEQLKQPVYFKAPVKSSGPKVVGLNRRVFTQR